MRDSLNSLAFRPALGPVVANDNTALVGSVVDRLGFDSLTFAILTGTLADADATFAVLVEHGDAANLSDAVPVVDAELISQTPGTAPEAAASFTFADDGVTKKIGYLGSKRYTRLTITPTGNAGNAPLAAVAVLANPALRPAA
jgi:hypothetical protein